MKASFHMLAKREMNEAADYYEAAVNGLGKDFLDEVGYAMEFIKTILRHVRWCI